jgi:excisionase family DNA binding protein
VLAGHPSAAVKDTNIMTKSPTRAPRMLTVPQVAEQLGFCDKTIRRLIERDELRVHRIHRQVRIAEDDLRAFLAIRRH